ncbi:AhpC/TSA family protein [Chitinophaga skermanii]|uniref:AhpC/TSA family protein n=1 Tax=Chitinophaga skermanii TaxID=331697 RepID=A0A327QLJ0_9BACT|nr:TlpA disulfide reductase family protein [Chitinophaga skermanii]RAJ05191.1 AhpC/TSA family protein [Chitinophaga skermanii]
MKKFVWIISIGITLFACHSSNQEQALQPAVEPVEATKDLMAYLRYERDFVQLARTFKAYDTLGKPMPIEQFLSTVANGQYFPLRVNAHDSSLAYQLYPIQYQANEEMQGYIRSQGDLYLSRYKRLGSPIPTFNYTDLNNQAFNNENLKDNIVWIKTWFISCKPCIEEMPYLDELKSKYANQPNIQFLALAFDKREALEKFQEKRHFSFNVIPVTQQYLADSLQANIFPSHYLYKNNRLMGISHEAKEMAALLNDVLHEKN